MPYPRTYAEALASTDRHLVYPDWDAMVAFFNGYSPVGTFVNSYTFIISTDGTYFYANNAFQTVYGGSSNVGGIDGTDFKAVLDAATAATTTNGGAIHIKRATYNPNGAIIIPANVSVNCEFGTVITPTGNFDVIRLQKNAQIHGAIIDVSSVTGWGSTALLIDGSDIIGATSGHRTGYSNLRLIGALDTGVTDRGAAIKYYLDGASPEQICYVNAENIYIQGFRYGILLHNDGSTGFINSNVFKKLYGYAVRYFIYLKRENAKGSVGSNVFEFMHQPVSPYDYNGITLDGYDLTYFISHNKFTGILWDTTEFSNYAIECKTGSRWNIFNVACDLAPIYDGGFENAIAPITSESLNSHGAPVVWQQTIAGVGEVKQSDWLRFYMNRAENTSCSAALAFRPSASDNSLADMLCQGLRRYTDGTMNYFRLLVNDTYWRVPLYPITGTSASPMYETNYNVETITGGSSAIIAHGLDSYPDVVLHSFKAISTDPGWAVCGTYTTTTFTFECQNSGTYTIAWYAIRKVT